jgi:hypothetical protein
LFADFSAQRGSRLAVTHVRSKTDVAMKNKVLCKFLCHNICCVIQAQCELGIEATFWPEAKQEDRDVLRMVRPG